MTSSAIPDDRPVEDLLDRLAVHHVSSPFLLRPEAVRGIRDVHSADDPEHHFGCVVFVEFEDDGGRVEGRAYVHGGRRARLAFMVDRARAERSPLLLWVLSDAPRSFDGEKPCLTGDLKPLLGEAAP